MAEPGPLEVHFNSSFRLETSIIVAQLYSMKYPMIAFITPYVMKYILWIIYLYRIRLKLKDIGNHLILIRMISHQEVPNEEEL